MATQAYKTSLAAVAAFMAVAFSGALHAETIALTAPEDGAVYDTHSPCVKEFYANFEKRGEKPPRPELTPEEVKARDACIAKGDKWHDRFDFFIFNDYTKDLQKRCEKEEKTWKPFTWKAEYTLDKFRAEFSETPDFAKPIVEKLTEKWDRAIRPKYLKLGTKYYWRVKAKKPDGGEIVSDVRSFTTLDVPPRFIGLPSENFRDMGGGVNADGKRVRQGMIYRGRAPGCNWSQERLKDLYVDKLGINLELDTRGQAECMEVRTKWHEGNLDNLVKRHVFVSTEDYHLFHPRSAKCLPEIFAYLADRNNYPIYTHCAVGSDRTGTVCVLLDGILGRDDRYIYDDYESPSFSVWLPRFRYGRKASGMLAALDPTSPRHEKEGPNLTGKNMRENAEQYLLSIGVPKAHLDAIREIMLEEPGEADASDKGADSGEVVGADAAAAAIAALQAEAAAKTQDGADDAIVPASATVPDFEHAPGKRLCAHRGFSTVAPENSLPAYGAAVALGASEIEFDLWWTKDGEIVSLHDSTLDRVSDGKGNVFDHTYEELKALDFGSKVSPHFKGLRIVKFEDILRKFSRQVIMNIHVKDCDAPWDEALAKKVIDLIDAYGARRHVYFMTSNVDIQDQFARLAPDIPRCMGNIWLDDNKKHPDIVDRAIAHKCQMVQLFKPYFDQSHIDRAHAAGLRVNVFWSDDPEEAMKFLSMGADTILTNDYQPIASATGLN